MNEALVGYCGLYCGGCPEFQKTQAGNPSVGEDGKPIPCDGCKSGRVTAWCTECEIKKCNRRKGLSFCSECGEYPCDILNDFMHMEKYVYHMEITEDFEQMKTTGIEAWYQKKEQEYYCNSCNHLNNWFEQECTSCGTKLKNGKNI